MIEYASGSAHIAFFADIAQILSLPIAGLAVLLAYRALSTWRRELRASVESQAALHLLGAAFKLHDAIRAYRSPERQMREIVINFSQTDLERHVLEERNRFFLEPVVADLREAEIKARVLWGAEIAPKLEAVTSCLFELGHQTEEYLRRLYDWPDGPRMRAPFFRQAEEVVKIPAEDGDPFGERVDAAIHELERYLRPKIPTYLDRGKRSEGEGEKG